MIALLDTPQDLDNCEIEIGCEVGQLLSPTTRRLLRGDRPWAIDNGCFVRFAADTFLGMLERNVQHRDRCLFVTVPDIVGSARRTLELFDYWKPRLAGWKAALAMQDGQEHLPIPWDKIDAVFIGGTTAFKDRDHAAHIVQTAKAMGKWVHVGRVNHAARFDHFLQLGADSIDGTGIARYSHMRKAINGRHDQHSLELRHEPASRHAGRTARQDHTLGMDARVDGE